MGYPLEDSKEVMPVHAHKLKVNVREDHWVEVRLPDDFPEGPAEVIVLANRSAGEAQRTQGAHPAGQLQALAALAELRSVQLTPEEQQILGEFESFQREHPIRFSSLMDED
jgi:hypothetical protein